MRRFAVLVRSAALEALAEPLSAILFLVALVAVHVLPSFHFHQFGEPGRLPRECGFSALLVFGLAFATSAAVHAVGRELESGTAAMALSRPVPRPLFFCAKVAGVFAALALFGAAVACATVLSVASSEMGRLVTNGGVYVWGPGIASGAGLTLFAFALAALANWRWRVRFCVAACLLMAVAQPVALVAVAGLVKIPFEWGLLPALGVLAAGCAALVAMAGACAVVLRPAAVAAALFVAVALSFLHPVRAVLPDIQRFWLVDSFAGGGTASVPDMLAAGASGVFLVAFWLVAGSALLSRKEIS